MSELSLLLQAFKNAFTDRRDDDNSVVINRDGSVRINLDSHEGRERILTAMKSVEHIDVLQPPDQSHPAKD